MDAISVFLELRKKRADRNTICVKLKMMLAHRLKNTYSNNNGWVVEMAKYLEYCKYA